MQKKLMAVAVTGALGAMAAPLAQAQNATVAGAAVGARAVL